MFVLSFDVICNFVTEIPWILHNLIKHSSQIVLVHLLDLGQGRPLWNHLVLAAGNQGHSFWRVLWLALLNDGTQLPDIFEPSVAVLLHSHLHSGTRCMTKLILILLQSS
jgi:hypothetical protein